MLMSARVGERERDESLPIGHTPVPTDRGAASLHEGDRAPPTLARDALQLVWDDGCVMIERIGGNHSVSAFGLRHEEATHA